MKEKAISAAVLAVAVLIAAGVGAYWWVFLRGPSPEAAFAAIVPTGPIACPTDPNDFSTIAGWAPSATASPASPATPAAQTCRGLRADVASRFDAIEQRITLVPTAGFNPSERGKAFATPDAAFAFVRDAIATEGYAGAMRGASGTLQSRGGSPADKALLLGALLTAQNVAVRYVHTDLAEKDLALAVAAANAPAPAPENPQRDDAFKALGVDAAKVRTDAKVVRTRMEGDVETTLGGAKKATDDLLATLADQHVTLAGDDASLQSRLNTNLRDHWWLQAQVNGNWIDYDPTLRGATTGTHLGLAPAGDPSSGIADAEYATITVRLTADRLAQGGGSPTTSTLVEKTVKAADAYAEPILVSLGDRTMGSDKIAQAASFTPTIDFKGDQTAGDAFATAGLLVVRMQIDTMQGGATRHVANRIVLDARNAAGNAVDTTFADGRRYAYGLTNVYEILAVSGELDPAFLGVHEAAGMHSLRAFMAYAAAGGSGKQMPPPGIAEAYPIKALRWFAYDALTRRLLEDDAKGTIRFTFDRPDIAIEHHGYDVNAPALRAVEQFDIADNAMVPAGTDRAAGVRANATRGYVDTEAERALFAYPGDGGTIALFDSAKHSGVGFTVLQGDLYGGTALAPQRPVSLGDAARMGWFSIDPQDGNLLGRMAPDGAGQERSEYAIARAPDWATLSTMTQYYGDFSRCVASDVEGPLVDVSALYQIQKCEGAAVCAYLQALAIGESYSRIDLDDEALLFNVLDLNVPGAKESWPPSGGAVCSALYSSPLYH